MNIAEKIRLVCAKFNISQAELARRIGTSPQNFNSKMKRGSFSLNDLTDIADAVGVEFEFGFKFLDGTVI